MFDMPTNSNQNRRGERIGELRELDEHGNPVERGSGPRGNTPTGGGGLFGRFKGNNKRNTTGGGGNYNHMPSGGGGGKGKQLIGLLLVFVLGSLFLGDGIGSNMGKLGNMFKASPGEHIDDMVNKIRDVQKVNQTGGDLHPIYDYNDIYTSEAILTQGAYSYFVYVYTGYDDKDGADYSMNNWVDENSGDHLIYKLYNYDINENEDITNIIGEIDKSKPILLYILGEPGNRGIVNYALTPSEADELVEKYINTVEEEEEEN